MPRRRTRPLTPKAETVERVANTILYPVIKLSLPWRVVKGLKRVVYMPDGVIRGVTYNEGVELSIGFQEHSPYQELHQLQLALHIQRPVSFVDTPELWRVLQVDYHLHSDVLDITAQLVEWQE